MNHVIPILLVLLVVGCATTVRPVLVAGGNVQAETVVAPPAMDPPPGVLIPIPLAIQGQSSDFFTATDPEGPWTYRTEDLQVRTNDDGTTSGYFANTPPGAMREFYLIAPVGYPLPSNIVTNH